MHIVGLMKGVLAAGLTILLLTGGCAGDHSASRASQPADYEASPPNLSFGPPAA